MSKEQEQEQDQDQAQAEAFRERVRRMPGVIMHDDHEPVPFVPEIWVEAPVDIDDLSRYDDEDGEDGLSAALRPSLTAYPPRSVNNHGSN